MQMVRCRNCGAMIPEHEAKEFNTGRVQYMCLDCYKAGCRQVGMHELKKAARKEKRENAKDR